MANVMPTEQNDGFFQGRPTQVANCWCGCNQPTVYFGQGRTEDDICGPQTAVVRLKAKDPEVLERLLAKMPDRLRALCEEDDVSPEEAVALIIMAQRTGQLVGYMVVEVETDDNPPEQKPTRYAKNMRDPRRN